jgi:hypothetical protein
MGTTNESVMTSMMPLHVPVENWEEGRNGDESLKCVDAGGYDRCSVLVLIGVSKFLF